MSTVSNFGFLSSHDSKLVQLGILDERYFGDGSPTRCVHLGDNATNRKIDMIAAWSVDRLGRSLRHLISFLTELRALNALSRRDGNRGNSAFRMSSKTISRCHSRCAAPISRTILPQLPGRTMDLESSIMVHVKYGIL
jgi:hypothetical protein